MLDNVDVIGITSTITQTLYFMKNNFYVSRVVFLMAFMLTLSWVAFGQDRKVTGSIQDAKGGGIPGVSVAVKGTTTGTTTDGNGAFSINVKSGNAELVITSVGYVSKSVAVGNRLLQAKHHVQRSDRSGGRVVSRLQQFVLRDPFSHGL